MVDLLDDPIARVLNLEDGCSFKPSHTVKKWGFYPETIWRFRINKEKPLIIQLTSGLQIMPNYEFTTNLGSIPLPLRIFFPKDEYPLEYALHDDEYNRHGIFVRFPGEARFSFYPTNRAGADTRLLRNIMAISKGPKSRAKIVYRAVRMGGSLPWKYGRVRRDKKEKGYVKICKT